MSRRVLEGALAACALATAACAGASQLQFEDKQVAYAAAQATAVGVAAPVLVTPLVDARPAALRVSHTPIMDERVSLLLLGSGFAFWNGRRDTGPIHVAGDHIRVTSPSGELDTVAGLDRLARETVAAVAGRAPEVAAAAPALDDLDGAAKGAQGIVVVPILDQVDWTQLASGTRGSGGAYAEERISSTSAARVTVASASLSYAAGTSPAANIRMRLVVLQTRGGAVISRTAVYGRGTGGDLGAAWAMVGAELAQGLSGALGSGSPPPAQAAPEVPR